MQLRYLSIPALIGAAGGDPWAINASLQIWLKVRPGPAAVPAPAGQHRAPVIAKRDSH